MAETLTPSMLRAVVLMHGETLGQTRNDTLFMIANSKKRAAILKAVRKITAGRRKITAGHAKLTPKTDCQEEAPKEACQAQAEA